MPQPSVSKVPAGPRSASISLDRWLTDRGLLGEDALARARLVRQESGERLDAVITRLGLLPEEVLARELAAAAELPLVPASALPTTPVPGPPLSVAFLHDQRAVPIAASAAGVRIAVSDPFGSPAVEAFRFVFGRPIELVVARGSDIDAAIDRLYGGAEPADALDEALDDDDLDRLKDLVSDAPVIRAVNRLIAQAVDARASDIHVEPTEDALTIRFRVDGVLREAIRLPMAMRAPLVSRVKVMANLNIAERRLPQDGRMRVAVRGHEIDLRVATAPSIHGESVVMRILDRSKLALDFATLGFDDDLARRLREAIRRPHGMVLVTGPTGSGKTTTLYAALSELNSPDRKLLTVEDPIEYRLPGVIQTQVNPGIGFTFGSALRSFLRQDPDVMMVGEIRDGETAEIAVQAALTGHMILSTLHTNTAAGAVTRLLDMAVEPFLLGSVLAGVLAQRLVRRLCPECREAFEPDAALLSSLGLVARTQLYHAVGCDICGGSGYSGRVALLEFLRIDDAIARLILARADTGAIAAAAAERGNPSLLQDGLAKAQAGLTTVEEVLRVAWGTEVALYRYRAIRADGSAATGDVEAVDHVRALAAVRQLGATPLELVVSAPVTERQRRGGSARAAKAAGTIVAELAVLLDAGLQLDRALGLAIENVEDAASAPHYAAILKAVREGAPLSRAMAARPGLFSPTAIAMAEAGEANGRLAEALARLAEMMARAADLRRIVGNAMVYPIALAVIAVGVIAMMLLFVVPQFESLFASSRAELPASSVAVMAASRFVRHQGLLLLGAVALIGLGVRQALRTPAARAAIDRAVLRIPQLGELIRRTETARFARTLGALLEGEVPLPNALALAQRTLSNTVMAAAIARIAAGVREGGGLTAPLAAAGVFPRLAIGFFRTGEETSRLGQMATRLADVLDRDVRLRLERLIGVLTPAITVFLGTAVAAIIASIMSAILGFNDLAVSS